MNQGGLFDHPSLREKFERYDRENPQVWRMFCRFTHEAINAGRARFSAKMVFERLRWYTTVETRGDDGFKLNNNYHAFYARKFMEHHPQHDGLFETRKQKSEVW